MSEFEGNVISGGMLLRGMGGKGVGENLGEKSAHIDIRWMKWFLGGVVGGLV
ncbi:hypothetical protein [Staphylococcus pasteuri]|uniref:hypothetical protein n=1 Tax=Staphylococcus pasteuri TaxID=45972 RepID=UPI0012B8096F|nr:hypothetical protein [Staphylococcus pasteuri]